MTRGSRAASARWRRTRECAHFAQCRRVPHLDGVVVGPREEAVRGRGEGQHGARVVLQHALAAPRTCVPHADSAVGGRGKHARAAEFDRPHDLVVALQDVVGGLAAGRGGRGGCWVRQGDAVRERPLLQDQALRLSTEAKYSRTTDHEPVSVSGALQGRCVQGAQLDPPAGGGPVCERGEGGRCAPGGETRSVANPSKQALAGARRLRMAIVRCDP